jgi:peptidoglycan/LPS O-acetylase OafA/YrhL
MIYLLFIAGVILLTVVQIDRYVFEFSFFHKYFSLSVVSLATMLSLPYLSQVKTGSGSLYRFITFTSIISYSIYLVHCTFFIRIITPIIIKLNLSSFFVSFIAYWLWAYGAAYLLHKFIELPFLNFRERVSPKMRSARPIAQEPIAVQLTNK